MFCFHCVVLSSKKIQNLNKVRNCKYGLQKPIENNFGNMYYNIGFHRLHSSVQDSIIAFVLMELTFRGTVQKPEIKIFPAA